MIRALKCTCPRADRPSRLIEERRHRYKKGRQQIGVKIRFLKVVIVHANSSVPLNDVHTLNLHLFLSSLTKRHFI